MIGASPTEKPDADAPVPPEGTEQAADQASKQQQEPPAESSTLETAGSVIDAADIATSVFDMFG
jgi:hypothetical protein